MIRQPPSSTRTYPLLPYTTLFLCIRLLRVPPDVRAAADLSSLRQAIHSAAPCPVDVKAAMIEWFGPRLYEFYAASEGNGFVAIDSEEWLAHPGSVGRSDKVRILDDEGALLPAGEVGQVFFTAGLVAFEYRGDDAKTRSEEHTYELQSLMRISSAVFCLKKQNHNKTQ